MNGQRMLRLTTSLGILLYLIVRISAEGISENLQPKQSCPELKDISSARRTENSPPVIIVHPEDEVVPKDAPTTLNCRAEGYPQPEITWYKDGEALNLNKIHYNLLPNGNLFLVAVRQSRSQSDDGVYQCEARNRIGVVRSNNATLTVAYLKDEFRLEPSNSEGVVGNPLVLECQPPKGNPSPVITWEKNRKVVEPDDERIRILPDGNLMISPAVTSDTGTYRCIATIEVIGSELSASARVVIHERPTIETPPEDITALPGEDVTFECVAHGDPSPSISWQKEGGTLPNERHTTPLSSLTIRGTVTEDSGVYICTAENVWGSVRASAMLYVDASPRFTVRPTDQTIREGEDIEVPCQAIGSPPPALMWKWEHKDEIVFPGESVGNVEISMSNSLIIHGADSTNERIYTCSTFSAMGTMDSPMMLRVVSNRYFLPPIIQYGPTNQTLTIGDTAVLTCRVGVSLGDGSEVTISWLMSDRPVDFRSTRHTQREDGTLEISSLEAQDAGLYTCVVGNSVGETSWSAKLRVVRESGSTTFLVQPPPSIDDLPVAPGMVEYVNQTSGVVTLQWPIKEEEERDREVQSYQIEGINTEDPSESWQVYGSSITNRADVRNLPIEKEMMFVVRAKNAKGYGPPSPISHSITVSESFGVQEISSDQESGLEEPPVDLPRVYFSVAMALSATTIKLMWQEPTESPNVEGFKVRYIESSGTGPGSGLTETVSGTNMVILKGLQRDTEYDIRVMAFSGSYDGPESEGVTVRTLDESTEDVRVAGDQSVIQTKLNECGISLRKVEILGPTDIKVTWQLDRHGPYIEGYYVKVQPVNNPEETIITITADRFKAIYDLAPWTAYTVTVQPFNGIYTGPETESRLVKTAESAPQAPPEVYAFQPFNATTFQVQWREPPADKVPGVILGYHIFCQSVPTKTRKNITVPGNTTFVGFISDLSPGLSYGIKVAAFTGAGMGPFSATRVATLPAAPNGPTSRDNQGTSGQNGASDDMGGFLGHPAFFAIFGFVLLLVLTSCILLLWRRRRRKHTHSVNSDKENAAKENAHKIGQVAMNKGHPTCCSGDGSSSSSDTLEKPPPPANPPNWPRNQVPCHWLQEAYDPPQFNVCVKLPNKAYLRQDSLSSSGVGSSNYPTLSTFHGTHIGTNSPEYAVVENPDEMSSPSPVPGVAYGPPVHPNFLPVGSLSGHLPHPGHHHLMEDPEPYASSTLVMPTLRKPQCSDSSSEWTNSWNSQDHHKKGERPPHIEQGRKGSRDEGRGNMGSGPPVPRRDHSVSGFSDQSSLYSSAGSSQGGSHRLHRHHLRKNPSPANWSELMPPPPEQSPPTDMNAPPPLPTQPRPSQSSLDPQHIAAHNHMMNIHQMQPGMLNMHHPNLNVQNNFHPANNMMGMHDHQIAMNIHQPGYNRHCDHQGGMMEVHQGQPPPVHGFSHDGAFQPNGHNVHSLERQEFCERCPDCKNVKLMQNHGGSFHGDQRRTQSPRTVQNVNPQNGALDTRTYPGPAHTDHFQCAPMSFQNSSPRPQRKDPAAQQGEPPYAQMQSGGSTDHYSEGSGSSIASQRVFADPRHAQIGQELLKYMSQGELRALAGTEAGYAPMKPRQTASKNGNAAKRRSTVSDSEMDDGTRETDFELVSNGRLSASCASLTSCNTSQCNSDCSGSEGSLIPEMDINSALSNMERKLEKDGAPQNGHLPTKTEDGSNGNKRQPVGAPFVSRLEGNKVKPALLHPKPDKQRAVTKSTSGKKEDVV